MLWFIFCVAVLNMFAGFGVAVYLAGYSAGGQAHEHEDLCEASMPEDFDLSFGTQSETSEAEEASIPTGPPEELEAEYESEADVPQQEDDPVDSSGNSMMAELDAAAAAVLGDLTSLKPDNEVVQEEEGKEVAPTESDTEVASPDQKEFSEDQGKEAIQAFRSQLESFCGELMSFDDQLRKNLPGEAAELRAQLSSVVESSQKQTEACRDAEQTLHEMVEAEAIDEKQGEAIIGAIQEGRQEAVKTTEALENLDLAGDPATQRDTVLERTASLLDANHCLRDSVSEIMTATLSPDGDDADSGVDALTGIMNRAGLDAALAKHWSKDAERGRAVSLTMFDLDKFADFNRDHGPALGDRAISAIAQLLESESPAECQVARFAGQQFAMLGFDGDLKQAVGNAEEIRQMVGLLRMEHGERDLKLTVSCGVVLANVNDTHTTLYTRASDLVQEAKRYKGNCCFVHEGEVPTPVVPPNLALTEKTVTL